MIQSQKKKSIFKNLIAHIMLLIFLFSTIKMGIALADKGSFEITNAEIIKKSTTADISGFSFGSYKVASDITFHKVGDSITYKITIKNNEEKDYKIKSVSDNNLNDFISYTYDSYEGVEIKSQDEFVFEMTEKYAERNTEIENRNQKASVVVTFVLEDEEKNENEIVIPINTTEENETNETSTIVNTTNTIDTNETVETNIVEENEANIIETDEQNVVARTIENNENNENNENKVSDTIEKVEADDDLISLPITGEKDEKEIIHRERDNLIIYAIISASSLLILIIVLRKPPTPKDIGENELNKDLVEVYGAVFMKVICIFIIVGAIVLPRTANAANDNVVLFDNKVTFKDKLIVSYVINGNEYEKVVSYDEKVELESPELEGYEFAGWEDEEGNAIDLGEAILDDIKIIAKFNLKTYSITYDLNGGNLEETNIDTYTIESEDIVLNNPTKYGYTFDGWTGTDLEETTENVIISKGSTGDRNYTAKWKANTYTISYNLNGGSVDSENPETYTIESENIELNNPTKYGYTFDGWTGTGLSGRTKNVTIYTETVGNREYTANYNPNTYTVIFDQNTGSGSMTNQTMTYDEETNLNGNQFTKLGYTFKEWNTQPDGSGDSYNNEDTVSNLIESGSITLYAQWQLNEGAVAIANDQVFSSLQSAVNSVLTNNVETKVTLLRNVEENITVANNKNIVFDLQNYTVKDKTGTTAVIKNNGTIKILNGTLTTEYDQNKEAIIENYGTVNYLDGTISTVSQKAAAVNNYQNAKIIMSGGKISVEEGGRQAIYSKGITEISGTAYLTSKSSIRATLQNESTGTLTVTAGKIIADNYAGITNNGNMTIGIKDGNVNLDFPFIMGSTYGINSSTDFNLYDGIMKGKTRGIINADRVTDTETDYIVRTSKEEVDGVVYKTAYLDKAVVTVTISGKKMYYDTIQAAVNQVPEDNTETTIRVLKDAEENITVNENKNIVFDIQNCKIRNKVNNPIISNYGTVKITNGTLLSTSTTTAAINNYSSGTLILSGGSVIVETGERQAIYNKGGFVEISGNAYLKSANTGFVDSLTLRRGTVTNISNGTVVIKGGTIIAENQYAISNNSTLTIGSANDGNVNSTDPLIKGKTAGIKNEGIFNFYDGIIKGQTASIDGRITNIEPNSIRRDTEEIIDGVNYKVTYLTTE